ncbi:cytochrome c [Bordetella avium]|uniref:cytochrome c n=1 Tax=Bordetella avium TaxID=521 RepID=UPI000E67DDE3|nr:cytochrome c [Bordetella avium]RIQ72919.1 cytochrome c [Bordetella avium]
MSGLPALAPSDLLHGLALRPPVVAWDGVLYQGSLLSTLRLDEVRSQAGVVAVVRHAHFAGVVAVTPLYARQAAGDLAAVWQAPRDGGAQADVQADAAAYHLRLPLTQTGARVIVWSLNGHTSVWLPACAPDVQAAVRCELAVLLQQADAAIGVALINDGAPAKGQLLDLMDAAAEAALLSQSTGRPVCVPCQAQAAAELVLRPAQAGAAEVLPGKVMPAAPAASVLHAQGPWAMRPSLARLLSQPAQACASAQATVCGDIPLVARKQTVIAPRASIQDLNAAQVFAQESLWHEQALAQGEDPVAWRLQHLPEGRAKDLARQVIERAGQQADDAAPGLLRGRGFATAQVESVDEAGIARTTWSAWVAEVTVQAQTGQVEVTRVVAGHDSQHLHAAAQAEIEHQNPRLLANARQLLAGPPAFDDWGVAAETSPAQGSAAELATRDPALELKHGALAMDGVVTLPAAAAIANAIHDATGVRLRAAPFDTEPLRLALAGRERGPRRWKWLFAGMAGLAGMAAAVWPVKPALPLTEGPDVSLYSAAAIERGRLVAAAGDCVVCHTAPGGKDNAGGLALETPFGRVYSTNITPDKDTGIGRWSYAAFERAMRQGVHQDGRQLYPAFPYTAFAKLSDGDMQALYGYLMSQPAERAEPPKTALAFPFNMRPLLAGWNALFHDPKPFTPDPSRSAQWLRGAYLVEGAGHCAACHSPRNRFGAEKTGLHYLAGGEAEGWTAPALNQLEAGGWSRESLFHYLRSGYSPSSGVAAGPMAPVIHGLSALPDSDLLAISTYLLDLPGAAPKPQIQAQAATPVALPLTVQSLQARNERGERIYQNACAACHESDSGPTLFGVKPRLSLNTNVHAATPDNLIQIILHGIQTPADEALGYMPGFKDSLNDGQIADLMSYLRERHAPGEPPWPDPGNTISRLRAPAHTN